MEKRFYKYLKRSGAFSNSVREEGVIRGEDLISLLPEPLLCHILSFLTTEQAVWTSVLSSRWRYLWKWVSRLELDSSDFTNDKVCVDFIQKILNFHSKSYLREFKLKIDQDVFDSQVSLYEPCLSRVASRNIHYFQVESQLGRDTYVRLSLSVCEALVCLKLHYVRLNDFESLSLPCLKIMYLEDVILPSDAAAETLISCSPVLEVLKICLSKYDFVVALRVCSQSLKSFTLKRAEQVYSMNGGHSVSIDSPKLEYLSLMDFQFRNFKITSMGDSVKVDIDVDFELMGDDVSEMNIIYNLLNNFSGVGDMTISWKTLKELVIDDYPVEVLTALSPVLSSCLVSSLESVEIESPITEIATELELAGYFLENSTTLKKLVLRLNQTSGEKHEPGVLEQLIESPRRSSLCQFEVIPVVPTPNPWSPWNIYVKPNRF